ncbi:inositol polyphosphate multikinase [Thraustotheca clavata]|uniref:Kinase n=1 Tax=Thraustotheca clavata TaxID=74557 RepID=A0A1V9ZZE6_9STRA|nr:inositol polyphosphate multikinase [Thraustotheca clavata]
MFYPLYTNFKSFLNWVYFLKRLKCTLIQKSSLNKNITNIQFRSVVEPFKATEMERSPICVDDEETSPSKQLNQLTAHMSAKVASHMLNEMKLRSFSTVSMARNGHDGAYSSSSNSSDESSTSSSPKASPNAAVAPLRLPSPRNREVYEMPSMEALLMPGKAFLQSFYAFLKEHRKSLRQRNPRLQVVLNPPCLHYLEHCFHAMLLPMMSPDSGLVLQWETKKDHPTINSSDIPQRGISKAQRMLKLAGFVLNIVDLHIQAIPDSLSLPSQCNLSFFSSLLYLKIDSITFELIEGLHGFKKQLLELTIMNVPLQGVQDILGSIEPYDKSSNTNSTWLALKSLSLIDCGLTKLDASLALAPSLQTLNLSSNHLTSLSHLENCTQLTHLNVSNNDLAHLDGAHRYLANVNAFILHHNKLQSVKGIEKMYGLQTLDIGHNQFEKLVDISSLGSLPLLQNLTLQGNEALDAVDYRSEALQLFGKEIILDSTPWTATELKRASFIRQRRKSLVISTSEYESPVIPEASENPIPKKEIVVKSLWIPLLATMAPDRLHDVVVRVGMACVLLIIAQTIATMFWPRDEESEAYITMTVLTIGGTLLITALPLSMLSYVLKQVNLTSDPCNGTLDNRPRSISSPKPPLSPRMQRQLEENLVDAKAEEMAEGNDSTLNTSVCSLNVLSTAMELLVENAEAMPLQDFIVMCREVAGLLHLLGHTGAFALKAIEPELVRLDNIWLQLHRDADITLQAIMTQEEEKQDHSSDTQDDLTSTVLRVVPILSYVRNLCLEMEKDRQVTLRNCASKAYLTSMAKQQRHPWLVQKAVLSAIHLNPLTRENLVGLWHTEDNDGEAELIEERLHACLKLYNGKVLKPFQNKGRGEREYEFYVIIQEIPSFLQFVPAFYGDITLRDNNNEYQRYIQMEDLLYKMNHPCVMDIKMGTKSYEPNASAEKIAYESEKFPLQTKVGFRLLGLKVYWPQHDAYKNYDKHYCRTLQTYEDVTEALGHYFEAHNNDTEKERARVLVPKFVEKLGALKTWFENHQHFHLIASSLLFVYDADTLDVDMRLIDFSHPQLMQTTPDEGMITGLSTLISIFSSFT